MWNNTLLLSFLANVVFAVYKAHSGFLHCVVGAVAAVAAVSAADGAGRDYHEGKSLFHANASWQGREDISSHQVPLDDLRKGC